MYFMRRLWLDDWDNTFSENTYKYRAFLGQQAKFNNTVEIKDQEILRRIHLNYRLLFLKDSVAAQWIDEGTLNTLINVHLFICSAYR